MSVTVNDIVDDVFLQRAGNKVVFIIRRRTKKGHFLPGSSKRANQYSGKPFAMPVGAATAMLKSNVLKRSKSDPENYHTFTSKQGNLWILMKKGYKDVRRLAGKSTDHVTMNWSGKYLRDLGVVRTGNQIADISFKSGRNQELASYHEKLGAGKSKRLHKILGLLAKEEKEMAAYLENQFMKKFKERFK